MVDCKELKKVMKKGVNDFLKITDIRENDGNSEIIEKLKKNFEENRTKLSIDEEKIQEIKQNLEIKLSKNEELDIVKYLNEYLENRNPTKLMALYSYFIEQLNSVKQSPQKGGGKNLGVISLYVLGLAVLATGIAAAVAPVSIPLVGASISRDAAGVMIACGSFLLMGTQLLNGERGNFLGINNPDVPIVPTNNPDVPIVPTNNPDVQIVPTTEYTTEDNLPVATLVNETYMLPTASSAKKGGNINSNGMLKSLLYNIDKLDDDNNKTCNHIQEIMKKNNIEGKLEEFNPPEERPNYEKLSEIRAQAAKIRAQQAEEKLNPNKGGRRMRKLKGKSLKKRGGRKSIKKCVKKVVKKGGRKSVRKTLNKRGRKSVRR